MAVGVLLVLGDVLPGLHLVRGGEVLRLGLAGEGEPEVEDVRGPVLPALAPGETPLDMSYAHLRSVSPEQPIFSAIERIAAHWVP